MLVFGPDAVAQNLVAMRPLESAAWRDIGIVPQPMKADIGVASDES
jgi:hypothetical protein